MRGPSAKVAWTAVLVANFQIQVSRSGPDGIATRPLRVIFHNLMARREHASRT